MTARCRTTNLATWITAATLTVSISACRMARMDVPADLRQAATEMPVQGRVSVDFTGALRFGPYEVTGIERGWTERTAWGVILFESSRAKQEYRFDLADAAGARWECQCAVGVDRKTLTFSKFLGADGELIAELSGNSLFTGVFRRKADGKTWRLAMGMKPPATVMNGVLTDQAKVIRVAGSTKLEGSSWPLMEASGYEFIERADVAGAADVCNDGTVWLRTDLPDETRQALACASTALLLYREINRL